MGSRPRGRACPGLRTLWRRPSWVRIPPPAPVATRWLLFIGSRIFIVDRSGARGTQVHLCKKERVYHRTRAIHLRFRSFSEWSRLGKVESCEVEGSSGYIIDVDNSIGV